MKPDDTVTGPDGRRWKLGPLLAVRGRDGCTNPYCTRLGGPDGPGSGELSL